MYGMIIRVTYYWDDQMGPFRAAPAGIERRDGPALAIRAIGGTLQRMGPIETVPARNWIAAALDSGRQAVAAGRDRPGLSGELVYGILDFCHQAVRDREDLPEWTPEAESRNAACVEAIAFAQRCVRGDE
ncbi:hypothetical protein [Actinoplanes sp. G11-F43]|uniref:hypothetical protein n=1 Tax=Actinoplanes sp. G11-F43 TaxID=3424130 RepID=UPI003D33AAC4